MEIKTTNRTSKYRYQKFKPNSILLIRLKVKKQYGFRIYGHGINVRTNRTQQKIQDI